MTNWGFPESDGKTLLVFGGSQGSEAINSVVGDWVSQRANGGIAAQVDGGDKGLRIIWATGKGGYHRYQHLDSDTVKVRPYISPMTEAYAVADLALCRAGAMTTAELAAWGIPSILVPLPTAAADHQTANAKALAASGASLFLPQSEITVTRLASTIGTLVLYDAQALYSMRQSALDRARPNAAKDIASTYT